MFLSWLVSFFFNLFNFKSYTQIIHQHLTKSGKYTHDLDVHLYCSFTVKDAGQHCDSLFSERKWKFTSDLPI